MWNFILQRAKAVVAVGAPLVTGAVIKAIEQGIGIDIPNDIEVYIIAGVTGLFVHQVPNKTP
jgi:hypothetical protein